MGRVDNNATQQETMDHDSFATSNQAHVLQPKEEDQDDLYQHPNAQYHHDHEEAESFPPKNEDEEDKGYAHAFPPTNFYSHDQHQHQHQAQPQPFPPTNNNVGIGANNVTFPQHQPAVVHIGHPVAALNTTAAPPQFQSNRPWNSGLFDCMNDPLNALVTACFPCITFGQIAEIVDSGNTSCGTSGMLYALIACCIAMPCILSCTYRTKMRGRFGLIETPAPDWVVHCFCEWCALCQEYRQLKDMNLDPSIGWQGNVAMQQQNQQYTMTPPMGQRMM